MTMPRPSLVTSSGPSPVRGFIAAIAHPLPARSTHRARIGTAPSRAPSTPQSEALAAKPASHNCFSPSPYYPVFGSRMVMIGHARRRDAGRTRVSGSRSPARPGGPAVGRGPGRQCVVMPVRAVVRTWCSAGRLVARTEIWNVPTGRAMAGACGRLDCCAGVSGTSNNAQRDPLSTLGGGGNRTRVLQYLTRASPGAAYCAFLSPGDHASKFADGLSRCEMSRLAPRPGQAVILLADAMHRVGGAPGLTDL